MWRRVMCLSAFGFLVALGSVAQPSGLCAQDEEEGCDPSTERIAEMLVKNCENALKEVRYHA